MKHGADVSKFVGGWRLLSCTHRVEGGLVLYPFGPKAEGLLVYTVDGYMSGTLMNPDRPRFQSSELFGGSDAEKKAAAEGYVHYGGTYEVLEDRIIHHVLVSLFPNWIGSRQQRFYRFIENRMELSTNPFVSGGKKQTAHLLWERAVPTRRN